VSKGDVSCSVVTMAGDKFHFGTGSVAKCAKCAVDRSSQICRELSSRRREGHYLFVWLAELPGLVQSSQIGENACEFLDCRRELDATVAKLLFAEGQNPPVIGFRFVELVPFKTPNCSARPGRTQLRHGIGKMPTWRAAHEVPSFLAPMRLSIACSRSTPSISGPRVRPGLGEILRVLRNDSLAAVSLRSRDKKQNHRVTQYDFRLFSAQDVSSLIEEGGFRDVGWTTATGTGGTIG